MLDLTIIFCECRLRPTILLSVSAFCLLLSALNMSSLTLRPGVLAAKEWLAQERAKCKEQHEAGSPGIQVCTRLTDMLDRVVLDLYQAALDDLAPGENAPLRSEIALWRTADMAAAMWPRFPMSI